MKVRRQLEFAIAASRGVALRKAPSTLDAVREIVRERGPRGLYNGFKLHFSMSLRWIMCIRTLTFHHLARDTLGTALYFLEYDSMRHVLGRLPSGEQGPTPHWLPIHPSLVPFFCGSLAGVTSWALIYPLDV